MTIDECYKLIQLIANKEQAGFISPEDFNRAMNAAQEEFFNDRYGQPATYAPGQKTGAPIAYPSTQKVHDDLRVFITSIELEWGDTLPDDYLHALLFIHTDTEQVLEFTEYQDAYSRISSTMLEPGNSNKIIWFAEGANGTNQVKWRPSPDDGFTGTVTMKYLRKPRKVVWNYEEDENGRLVYKPSLDNVETLFRYIHITDSNTGDIKPNIAVVPGYQLAANPPLLFPPGGVWGGVTYPNGTNVANEPATNFEGGARNLNAGFWYLNAVSVPQRQTGGYPGQYNMVNAAGDPANGGFNIYPLKTDRATQTTGTFNDYINDNPTHPNYGQPIDTATEDTFELSRIRGEQGKTYWMSMHIRAYDGARYINQNGAGLGTTAFGYGDPNNENPDWASGGYMASTTSSNPGGISGSRGGDGSGIWVDTGVFDGATYFMNSQSFPANPTDDIFKVWSPPGTEIQPRDYTTTPFDPDDATSAIMALRSDTGELYPSGGRNAHPYKYDMFWEWQTGPGSMRIKMYNYWDIKFIYRLEINEVTLTDGLEWGSQTHLEICFRALGYLGIHLSDQMLTQYAEGKQTQTPGV